MRITRLSFISHHINTSIRSGVELSPLLSHHSYSTQHSSRLEQPFTHQTMGSASLPLQTKGIFRNLPTFSPDITGLTALVTGANGISGFHTMRVLLESPERWKKVWAASRRPPPKEMMDLLTPDQRSRVEHVACDFLTEPGEIAKQLKDKGVTADYVFFCEMMFCRLRGIVLSANRSQIRMLSPNLQKGHRCGAMPRSWSK